MLHLNVAPYKVEMSLLDSNPIFLSLKDNYEGENHVKDFSKSTNKDFPCYLMPVCNLEILGCYPGSSVLPHGNEVPH